MLLLLQSNQFYLWSLLVTVFTYGCQKIEPSDSQAFIGWASKHAIAVESLNGPLPTTSLEWLQEAIGSVRVVGVGESRHDTREQLLLKRLLVRHLIEDLGFRTLILEESIPHAESLDRYVTSGEGNLCGLMNSLARWYLWDTEEMLELVEWVRQFNKGRKPGAEVRIFGMDITAPAVGVRSVLDYLRAAGTELLLDAPALGLDLQRGDFWPVTWQRYAVLSDERQRDLGQNDAKLIKVLEPRRAELIASTSEERYERMLWLAEVGGMGNALFSSGSREAGGAIRERGMARTVLRLLDREIAGEKAIIWTHNLHVARSTFRMPDLAEGTLQPMGMRLSEELGDSYVAVGGSFGEGLFGADLPPGERHFPAVSVDVLDGALAEVGVAVFLIDLREVEADSEAARWLRQDRQLRAQDSWSVLVPGAAFDLLYFVGNISRSQPTPLALRRFQSLEEQN